MRLPSKLGGVRKGLLRQESGEGGADTMGESHDPRREPRSNPVCVGIDLYNQCLTGGGINDIEIGK